MTNPLPPVEPVVAVVIPLRQLESGERPLVRRKGGRPRRVENAPTISEAAYMDALAIAASAAEAQDEPLQATLDGNAVAVIDASIRAVAVETGALAWERARAMRAGKPEADRIASRRTNALMRLADLVLVREQLRRESQDLDPELLDRAVGLFALQVEDVIREVVDAPTAEQFIATLRARLDAAGPPSTWDVASGSP